ncbi:lysozyme [Escherichia coli]|nr:lysozyme [Escherichia coli]
MAGIPKKLKATLLAVTIAGGGVGGYQEMTRQSLIHLENIAYMPYRDIGGVLSVCVGHTGPDIEMRRYSHAECMALLDSDLKPVYAAIDRLVRVPLTPYQKTALATFIFNTGVTAFSKSTLLKKLNAGDYDGARDQMARWVFAAGHKWKGLMNRREVEMAIWNIRGADDLRQ